mgnify:CR=1 FL=1
MRRTRDEVSTPRTACPRDYTRVHARAALSQALQTMPHRRAPRARLGGAPHPLKESVHKLLVVDVAEGLPARVERAILGERDHVVNRLAHLLALGQSRRDRAVADALRRKRPEEGLALVGGPAEAAAAHRVSLPEARSRTGAANGHKGARCAA